jgi:S1-C subfamily serine protease
VITTLDGATVDSANTLSQLLDNHHPGDRVRLGWTDTNGRAHTATITLMTGPVG